MFIFVSDVHLDEPHSKRYGAFLCLLDRVLSDERITGLFLVGDIFDLWLGDRKVFVQKHPLILEKIKKIAATKEVHYFEGNHDFQLGKFWRDKGVLVHPGEYSFLSGGKTILVSHGDQLNQEDKNYLKLRWFFRTALARFLIKTLPNFILLKIGEGLSTTGQKSAPTKEQRSDFLVKWKKWTESLYAEKKYDVFICGHYHFRVKTDVSSGAAQAVNLGSWLEGEDFQILEFEDCRAEFKKV